MRILLHVIYWTVVLLFLVLFFGQNWESHLLAFYFSCLLLPIVMGTTYFFNQFLVPQYLFVGRYWTFALYSFYMLVVSLYLEILVALYSFVMLANYNLKVMGVESTSVLYLGVTLYLIVFLTSFIRLVIQLKNKSNLVETLEEANMRNSITRFTIKADRQTHQMDIDELLYFESLDDYVKVVSQTQELVTRHKISKIQSDLPDHFIRIHRSFIVNQDKVSSFTHESVLINETTLPISRTYKKEVLEVLQQGASNGSS